MRAKLGNEDGTVRIRVANDGVQVGQALVGVDVAAQLRRRRKYLPECLYLLVGREELLAKIGIEEARVHNQFQVLVGTFSGGILMVQIACLGPEDLAAELIHQQVETFHHSTYVG